jgi:phosphatidylglycerol:prolipoprotein diacylglycerol transferase
MLGLYLMGYGIVRFFLEFFRQPDAHLMFVLGPFTMGQVLCASMVLIGIGAFIIGRRAALRTEAT